MEDSLEKATVVEGSAGSKAVAVAVVEEEGSWDCEAEVRQSYTEVVAANVLGMVEVVAVPVED